MHVGNISDTACSPPVVVGEASLLKFAVKIITSKFYNRLAAGPEPGPGSWSSMTMTCKAQEGCGCNKGSKVAPDDHVDNLFSALHSQ